MALLDSLPGVEVTVCVEGEALQEYAAENDEVVHQDKAVVYHQQQVTTTKFIESATGKPFLVRVNVKAPFKMNCDNIAFAVRVDGKHIRKSLMSKKDFAKIMNGEREDWSVNIEGPIEQVGSGWVVRLMHFAEIQSSKLSILTAG